MRCSLVSGAGRGAGLSMGCELMMTYEFGKIWLVSGGGDGG